MHEALVKAGMQGVAPRSTAPLAAFTIVLGITADISKGRCSYLWYYRTQSFLERRIKMASNSITNSANPICTGLIPLKKY